MLFALCIMWPTLEVSGKGWILAFWTWDFFGKHTRFSCNCLQKLLVSSLVLFNMNLVFALQFLVDGVPSMSHLLKFFLPRRFLTSVQKSLFSCWLGFLSLMVLFLKEMLGAPLIPLIYGIHSDFQEFPKLFFNKDYSSIMALATILLHRWSIHSWFYIGA